MTTKTTFELAEGKYLKLEDINLCANEQPGKAWLMLVRDTHPERGVDGPSMPSKTIDGEIHFDILPLRHGDIFKVSGENCTYWQIEENNDEEVTATRMTEADVFETLGEQQAAAEAERALTELRATAKQLVEECDDEGVLEAVIDRFQRSQK